MQKQAVSESSQFAYSSPSPAGATTLIVPGLNGSPEDHWQSVWERERPDCRRVNLRNWDDPWPETWVPQLDDEIRAQRAPVVLVAHSLGCIATILWCQSYLQECRDVVKGLLLVAPCDPEADTACAQLRRFGSVPRYRPDVRSILVASTNDQYASLTRSKYMAALWGSEFVNLGTAGHINAHSNLGAWAFGQTLLGLLQGNPIGRA